MPDSELSVEGPEFVKRVEYAEEVVQRLEANDWDFAGAAEVFAPRASADVIAKEIATIHDGQTLTRIGRLTMVGTGPGFNLMGRIPARAELRNTGSAVLDGLADQLGSTGVKEIEGYDRIGTPQSVEFFNHTMFFQLRDLVFWNVLHGTGCFPSTLEHMARGFSEGKIVQNVRYRPSRPSEDTQSPAVMQAQCMSYSYPSDVVEWMDKPLYGGAVEETMHVEYLVTPNPTDLSHPYLDLMREGTYRRDGQEWFVRQFGGLAPKAGLRDVKVPPEQPKASTS